MSKSQDDNELGAMGEEFFVTYLSGVGLNPQLSTDKYDPVKDITDSCGRTYQIKTQWRLGPPRDCLTLQVKSQAQLQHLGHVDFLVFIEFDETDYIKIWTVKDRKKFQTFGARGKSGDFQQKRGYSNDNLQLCANIYNPTQAARFRAYSTCQFTSHYAKKNYYAR